MVTIFGYIIMKCDIVKYMPKLIFQYQNSISIFNFNSIQFQFPLLVVHLLSREELINLN